MTGSRASTATLPSFSRLRLGLSVALLALATSLLPAPAFADEPSASGKQPPAAQPAEADADQAARVEAVIAAARAYLGTAYRVGTEGPDTIDCSGLVFRAFANAGELRQVGGARLRAAGYQRWFAARNLLTTDAEQAERGDLVMYANGKHIGIYLGDGRVISALVTGVTVHSIAGITQPVTGFLAIDWSGKRGPFKPTVPPSTVEEPEAPAALVPAASWMPAAPVAETAAGPIALGKERADMRTANTRTFETRGGRFITEVFSRPIHYLPDGATEWQPIDLRFRLPQRGEEFAAAVDTSPVALTLRSPGSRAGLLEARAGEVAVTLEPAGADGPAVLEVAADGRWADYRDLLGPGTGLRVLPRADGFKSFMVFAAEPAGRTLAFDLLAPGLTPSVEVDGSLVLRDGAGAEVGRLAKPMLLDSSDVSGDAGGVRADAVALSVEAREDGAWRVLLAIDRAALAEAVYPAYVDLALVDFPSSQHAAAHTFVSSSHPNANFSTFGRPESGYAEMWHGRRPDRRDDNAAYLRFPGLAQVMRGVTIESASLAALPYWQGGTDAAAPSWLGRVTTDWDLRTLNWNTRPAADLDAVTYETTQGQWSAIDVGGYVRDVVAGASHDYGLVLHADGAGRGHWKRLIAESGLAGAALEPRLVITWSGLRPAVSTATAGSDSVDLAWTNAAFAPATQRVQVQLSTDGFATVSSRFTPKGSAAAAGALSLPAGDLAPGTYSWRVRAKYGDQAAWSAWSDHGTFTVAATSPTNVVHRRGMQAF